MGIVVGIISGIAIVLASIGTTLQYLQLMMIRVVVPWPCHELANARKRLSPTFELRCVCSHLPVAATACEHPCQGCALQLGLNDACDSWCKLVP